MNRSAVLIREARVGAGLTQRQLAQRCGVGATLISAYENGRRVPSGDTLLRVVEATGGRFELVTRGERLTEAAGQLEQVAALGMQLPRREPGPLAYPSFRRLLAS